MSAKAKKVRWICATCGEPFTRQVEVDRHDPSHVRVETVLESNEREMRERIGDAT